ncbi:hypothetical protein FBEOM_4729 [Fusarium beomiforme]|uniref:Aminoglycoside phosphotransferase domain-containing protein n=1 Tax=Fusarium beomiforme TaxID=44412 RepID=A0A9P5DZP4_9HYPO|nr:hypothetical protein FBEOM_4729 [Fusarium beomiforme]
MVRRIEFTYGINRVARFRLPELKAGFGDREILDVARILRMEVASMKFLRSKSSITVPEFFIGSELETGKGLWKFAIEYYNDRANHGLHVFIHHGSPDIHTTSSFAYPILCKHLMSLYSDSSSNKGRFSLANRDFGAHNLLVDDDFQIFGVIDFDGVMAAPVEVVAQYPV